ncbi:MAG: GTPase Era [Gammaproteobacteria bacterium]
MTDPSPVHRSGHIAIVGRPNVGKSTLLNRIVGQKLSITSDRPQTTRHRIAGIVTRPDAQLIFIDSPGYQTRSGGPMNRVLNRTAVQVATDADVVVLVCDARGWTAADERLAKLLPRERPVLLAVNKVDTVAEKSALLPLVERASHSRAFDEVVPISAKTGRQVPLLLDLCAARLPEGPAPYAPDSLTDRSERFLAAELIREKLFRRLGDEVPYDSTVEIERYEEFPRLRRIHAVILVDRESQKPIVLGAGGERIKRIATDARIDLEKLFGCKVYLELFVKVKSGWAESEQSLRAYGYE